MAQQWKPWSKPNSVAEAERSTTSAAVLFVVYSVVDCLLSAVTIEAEPRMVAMGPLLGLIFDLALALGIYRQYRPVAVIAALLVAFRTALFFALAASWGEASLLVVIYAVAWVSVVAAIRGAFAAARLARANADGGASRFAKVL